MPKYGLQIGKVYTAPNTKQNNHVTDIIFSQFKKWGGILYQRFRIYVRRRGWENHYANATKGLTVAHLTEEERKAVDKLFKNRFKYSFISHIFYKSATGIFDPRYIPDAVHFCDIDPHFNDWELAKKIDNKCMYKTLFAGLPQPRTVTMRQNGFWYDANGDIVNEATAISAIVQQNCFLKQATESEGGHGVYFIEKNESAQKVQDIVSHINADIIVQEGIEQSDEIAKLNSSSVNTLRFFTLLKKDGTPKIYSVCLRMGINGAKVDNASSGGIVTGVNDDGTLKSVAYSANGKRYDVHPTSGVHFETIQIPNYDLIKEMILKEVTRHPHFRQVTWDIAIDKNNMPVFIEANLRMGEIDFLQLNNGPLYGDDTEEIFNEVFGN